MPRPFPRDIGIASARIWTGFRYSCGRNEGTEPYISGPCTFAPVGSNCSRVEVSFFCARRRLKSPLVPIDRLETIPGHYAGVVTSGRRTTSPGEACCHDGDNKRGENARGKGRRPSSLPRSTEYEWFIMHPTTARSVQVQQRKVRTRNRATITVTMA